MKKSWLTVITFVFLLIILTHNLFALTWPIRNDEDYDGLAFSD